MIAQVCNSYWYVLKTLNPDNYKAMYEARTKRKCLDWVKENDIKYKYVIAKGDNLPGSLCVSVPLINSINDLNK